MRRYRRTVAMLAVALSGLAASALPARAQTPAPLPSVQLPRELDRVLRDYETAWAAGDAGRVAALFTEDGFVLSSGRPPVRGRAAIEAMYRNASGDLRLRAIAFHTDGTAGWILGMFGYGERADAGKFTLTLRRRAPGDAWLISSDMDNTNSR